MVIKKIAFLLSFCYGFINQVEAQSWFENFTVSRVTPDDGLSQGSNYFRFEDSLGFMWITANDALNRYDGKTIKVYNRDNYFDKCPNLQQGYGFAEDDKTNIYIGSTKGLYIYNRQKNKFTLQKIFEKAPDAIAMPIGFRNGKIYCFNRSFQLASYDVTTKKCEFVAQMTVQSLPSVHVYQLYGNLFYFHYPFVDKNNKIWIFGNHQIESFDIKTRKTKIYPHDKKNPIHSCFYDFENNRILIGTKNGISIFDLVSNRTTFINEINGLKLKEVTSICASENIVVFNNFLDVIFASSDFKKSKVMSNASFSKTRSHYLYGFDKSKRLWFSDDSKGQVVVDFKSKLLKKFPEDTELLFSNFSGVGTFSESSDGAILVNAQVLFDSKNRIITKPPFTLSLDMGVRTFRDDFRNGTWIVEESDEKGRKYRNIYFFDRTKKSKAICKLDNSANFGSFQDMSILANGAILCSFNKGLFWLNPESGFLEKAVGIDLKNPFMIKELSKNRIAISYINNDMLIAEILPNKNLRVINKLLPNIQSFYIQEDKKRNRFWIGTNQGVYLLDSNFKLSKKFDINSGLAGTYIYGLLLDDFGNVYCSHQRGMSSIYAYTFQVVNYDKNDGIQDWDFNNRAFYKATNGTLYFGGANGFNYFKPPLVPESYYKPEVYIDEILINGSVYNTTTNPNGIRKLKLNHKQNNISISALVKDLKNANSLQLIYKIKEKDKKWNRLTNGAAINFSNLSPNTYTLQLGYFDKYANKEVFQKTLLLTISAPFYQESWFLVLVASMLTGFVFWIFNNRKLAKQQQLFQQQLELEKQRNKITADLHDEIGSTLSSLQINSTIANKLLDNDAASAQQVLTKVENQAKSLADKIGDIIWSMKPGKDEFMTLSTRIKNFCNEVLGSTDINYKIEIDAKIDSLLSNFDTRKNILLITKEAINNALKYSKATQILVTIQVKDKLITLIISDNGVGFDTTKIVGNGIGNIKKRAHEMNATLVIDSNKLSGTKIQLQFTLN